VPWKVNEEAIDVDTIPARAFDSPPNSATPNSATPSSATGEKQRVAAILEPYNDDLTLTQEEDDAFGQLARERTARHPLRTYLWVPAARAVVIWFAPRIELLPISGNVFPLAQMYDEDAADQAFTILLFLLNIAYVGLGVWGAVNLWRSRERQSPDWRSSQARSPEEIGVPTFATSSPVRPAVNDALAGGTKWRGARPAVAFLILFVLLRTAFLTTLETPEPRYVLVCFPILIALGAQLFCGKAGPQSSPVIPSSARNLS